MRVHVYFKINEPRSIETSRVTVTDKDNPITPGQWSLVLGTRGTVGFEYYPLEEVRWFWVEDD